MSPEIRFRTERQKLEGDAREFRSASADDRLEVLFELADLCEALADSSRHRERQLELLEEEERVEQERWKELIARHASG